MFSNTSIIANYKRNVDQIRTLTDSLSQAESLIQPPADWNCVNWIVGHIACYRNLILSVLSQPSTLDPDIAKRYPNGSAPVRGDEPGIGKLDEMLKAITDAQEGIARGIESMAEAQMSEVLTTGMGPMRRDERLVMLLRHEGYHTGQLEFLRALIVSLR